MIKQVNKLLNPISKRLMQAIARAIINLVDDTKIIQLNQCDVLDNETREETERFQNYGFNSNPHPGAEAIIVRVGGNADHGIVIACEDRRYRVKNLAQGEVAIYTDEGDKIHFKRGRIIEITCGTQLQINCPDVRMSGRLQVEGDIYAKDDIVDKYQTNTRNMREMRTVFNAHVHPENGTTTSATATPM